MNENKILGNLLQELNINSPEQIEDRLYSLLRQSTTLSREITERYKKESATIRYGFIKSKLMRFLFRQTSSGQLIMNKDERVENNNMLLLATDKLNVVYREFKAQTILFTQLKRIEVIKENN